MDNNNGDSSHESDPTLLKIPRELRDEILKNLMKVDEITDFASPRRFYCYHQPCVGKARVDQNLILEQQRQVRKVLKTCRQTGKEGAEIFYDVNVWTLQRARLRPGDIPNTNSTLHRDTVRMFEAFCFGGSEIGAKSFKHFEMRIDLSDYTLLDPPRGYLDGSGLLTVQALVNPHIVLNHLRFEAGQCRVFKETLNCFSEQHTFLFPLLQSFKVAFCLHLGPVHPPGDPTDRCGLTIYITILFEAVSGDRKGIFAQEILDFQARAVADLDFEPRRDMLVPLAKLRGVRAVKVDRRWTVKYLKHNDSGDSEVTRSLFQHARFSSVKQFLDHAGPKLNKYFVTGLEHINVPANDLIEICEDVAGDDEPVQVPIAGI